MIEKHRCLTGVLLGGHCARLIGYNMETPRHRNFTQIHNPTYLNCCISWNNLPLMLKEQHFFEVVEVSPSSTGSSNFKRAKDTEEIAAEAQARGSIFIFASKSDIPYYIAGVVFTVVAAAGSPIQTYLYGKVFGELTRYSAGSVTGSEFLNRSRLLCGAVVAVGGGRMFFTWGGIVAWLAVGERQQQRARRAIFSRLLSRHVAWFDTQENLMGSMTQACRSIEEVRNAASLSTEEVVSAAASVIFLFATAMESLWRLTLVIMALTPVMAGASFFFGRKAYLYAEAENDASAQASQVLDWSFAQGDLVRILNGKYADAARLARLLNRSRAAYFRMAAAIAGNGAVLRMLGNFLFVQGFWFGEYLVSRRIIGVSSVLTAFTSCLLLGAQVASLATATAHLNQGKAAAATIARFGFTAGTDDAEMETQVPKDESSRRGQIPKVDRISLNHVSFTYRGTDRAVLSDVSFNFDTRQLNFVVGRSGSGKSTIALLLMGFYPPLNGNICIDGVDIAVVSGWPAGASLAELAPLVFARTVAENVSMGSGALPEKIARACAFARIDPNLTANKLSGGQIQQVGLARAYARDLPVVILDEALSAIDTKTKREIWRDFRIWCKGRLTIVITHEIAEAEPQDQVLMLENGRTVAQGRAHDIPAMQAARRAADKILADIGSASEKIPSTLQSKSSVKEDSVSELGDEMEMAERIDSLCCVLRFFWASAPSRGRFVGATAVCAVSASAPAVLSYCTSKLLQGTLATSYSIVLQYFMVKWSVICIGIAVADAAAYFVGHWGLEMVLELWIVLLRAQAAAAVADQDMQFFATRHHGPAQLTTLLMNDARDLRSLVADFVAGIVLAAVLVSVGLVWALFSGWRLALVGFAFVPVLLIASAGFSTAIGRCEAQYKDRVVATEAFNNSVVAGVRTVKACGLARAVGADFDHLVVAVGRAGRTRAIATGFGISFIELCSSAATGTIIYYGMQLVATGRYSQEQMVETLSLLTFTLVGTAGLVRLLPQIARGQRAGTLLARLVRMAPLAVETGGCGERVSAVLARAPSVGEEVVALEDVHFAYGDAEGAQYRAVLRGANLSVRAGECVALVGESGSGKSTAAQLMARLYRADRGRVIFRGQVALLHDSEWYRERVVVVPQQPRVFSGTVRDNLCYGVQGPTLSADLWRALEDCAAADLIRQLPGALDARVADCALSLGQLQRLCVARAVVRRPQVLVFDECTLHLDRETAEVLATLICGGLHARHPLLAVVVITHDLEVARKCDRVVRVNKGVFVSGGAVNPEAQKGRDKSAVGGFVDARREFVQLPNFGLSDLGTEFHLPGFYEFEST